MGPISILDKSAFQALSAREHLFLSKHLYPNITPVLVFEVLGDLTKQVVAGSKPTAVVQGLAGKFGGSGGPVNASYLALARGELLGVEVPMTGQIIPDNWFQSGSGAIIDLSPLNESILRWSQGQFTETEEQLSALWRTITRSLGFSGLKEFLQKNRVLLPRPDNEDSITTVADTLLGNLSLQDVWFDWALEQFVPDSDGKEAAGRIWARGASYLQDHAPYAAHCLRCLMSLTIAVRHGFLGNQPTHLVDLQYLYYLPFCHVLISDDRVHRLLGPQLVRVDQSFARGGDLKASVRELADDWEALPEDVKKRRSFALGSYPPPIEPALLFELWRKHMTEWTGDRPAGNLAIQLTDEEALLAMEEARALLGRESEQASDQASP